MPSIGADAYTDMLRTDDWIGSSNFRFRTQPMMAFCGPDLCELYVTSATHGKRGYPNEGGIFRVRVDVPGLARLSRRSRYLNLATPSRVSVKCVASETNEGAMPKPRQTVVVTGASAGVGRAIAVDFGKRGWQVAVIARGREGLESAKREIEAKGGRALAIQADVADANAVMRAADQIEAKLGPIDVWVNNAMVTIYASIADIAPDEFHQVTQVTYLGQVHGTLAALKHMRRRNRGVIICIGSALAYRSIPFQGPYCAAKAAVRGFVDSLRSELLYEQSKIRLTMVHLPAVNTPQFDWARNKFDRKVAPVPPIFQPETIADSVVRAAQGMPREYWLGFSTVKAILAQMLVPSLADRILAKSGKASETTNQPSDHDRPDNLYEAGRGDPGAHGRFDNRSSLHAFPFNPAWLRAGFAFAGAAAAAVLATLATAYVAENRDKRRSILPASYRRTAPRR